MSETYREPAIRWLITASVMGATVMNSLDTTIANVALPHIQGSVAASSDEISWVLTSYIVAAAICTPLSGWLAGRFGRKRLMIWSVTGFTIASVLCGVAHTLGEIVGFRLLQGIFGAALIPMSQVILLDTHPPENHGSAMAIWSMGAVLGPVIGPTLGGWLTDNLTWRWVFFINVPVGLISLSGLLVFFRDTVPPMRARFDLIGFATLGLAIASLQLMLDRGQTQDWFNSSEIWIEAISTGLFLYLFLAHSLTTAQPFVNLSLFLDRNFAAGCMLGFVMGVTLFGVLALLPPMLEGLFGYPVVLTGLVTAPRGLGTLLTMSLAAPLLRRVEPRVVISFGMVVMAYSLHRMAGFSLGMDYREVVISGFIQGISTGFIFVPLALITFGTLESRLRNEAAAMFTLLRNLGSAIGIAVLQATATRNGAIVHARLAEGVRPDNPVMAWAAPDFDFNAPRAVAALNAQITAQASMVALVDSFYLLFVLAVVTAPLVLMIRKVRQRPAADAQVHMD